jgi:hypothetical protein
LPRLLQVDSSRAIGEALTPVVLQTLFSCCIQLRCI